MGVAYKEDVDRVVALMKDVGAELRQDTYFGSLMIQDIEVFGLDKFADSALVIKARIKTQPIKQWEVGREYNRRLKRAFDAAGVEIPFPHQSLYFGEPSKPLLVRIAQDLKT
jgi:small conductance mechanosensitive channel